MFEMVWELLIKELLEVQTHHWLKITGIFREEEGKTQKNLL